MALCNSCHALPAACTTESPACIVQLFVRSSFMEWPTGNLSMMLCSPDVTASGAKTAVDFVSPLVL